MSNIEPVEGFSTDRNIIRTPGAAVKRYPRTPADLILAPRGQPGIGHRAHRIIETQGRPRPLGRPVWPPFFDNRLAKARAPTRGRPYRGREPY